MLIKETGFYELTEDIKTRNVCSIATIEAGTIIEITQIDDRFHKVIGPDLMDWKFWDLPAKKFISKPSDFETKQKAVSDE